MAVRHYRLTLTVDGLVHIGNGNRYSKADYFLDNGKLAILDVASFVGRLSPEQLDAYCNFLEYEVGEWRGGSGFEDFLGKHKDLRAIARRSVAYHVDAKLVPTRRGTYRYYDVQEFVKDAEGNPYVPGSCVKGMLRTALLTCLVLEKRSEYERIYRGKASRNVVSDRRFELTKADAPIMKEAFRREHPDADDPKVENDVLRYVSVSDSDPLSVDDLVFASKYDQFSELDDGHHKAVVNGQVDRSGNSLNIYRECLKPGTKVTVDLDIDDRIDTFLDGIVLDTEGLEKVFERSYELYEHCFLEHFEGAVDSSDGGGDSGSSPDGICCYVIQSGPLAGVRCRNRAVEGSRYCNTHQDKAAEESSAGPASKEAVCYLGGGVDYDSKTIMNALFDDDLERLGEISRILYAQFGTKLDFGRHQRLASEVREAGFTPGSFKPRRNQFKVDHRHWQDPELGVAPHTLKFGELGGQRYPMGKCSLAIAER